MFDTLKEILVRNVKIPDENLTPEATRSDIGLDSLAVVELSVHLESELGVEVTEEELNDARTVGDIAALVQQRIATV